MLTFILNGMHAAKSVMHNMNIIKTVILRVLFLHNFFTSWLSISLFIGLTTTMLKCNPCWFVHTWNKKFLVQCNYIKILLQTVSKN